MVGRRLSRAWTVAAGAGSRPRHPLSRLSPQGKNEADGEWPRVAPPRVARPPRLTAAAGRLIRPLPLLGVGLIVVALVGFVNGGRPRTAREYVAATRALPAGSVLAAGDLAPTALSGAPQLLARLIPASREAALVGRRLAAPVEAGLPVPWASLAGVGGAPAAFTLAVGALHALGGALEPGDLVTVLATFTSPNGTVTVRVVGRGLVVLSVGQPPPGLDLASATIPVTVALGDPAVASELALANSVGRIDLMRDGDAAASTPSARAGTGTL